jgi:DNA repair protein RadC
MKLTELDERVNPVRMVKDMSPDDQPREKMQKHGPDVLSNAELLAIIMRTGTQRMNVIDLSRTLLDQYGGLHQLAKKPWNDICRMDGIGNVKAVTVVAALELGRRLQIASTQDKVFLKNPDDVYSYFGAMMRDLRKEVFIIAFLNSAKRLIGFEKTSIGGQTATIVDPPEIIRQAIMHEANSVILLHNHPSGNPVASQADIQLTKRICEAGRLVGIPVEDHVIIAGYEYVSLRSRGLMG